MQARFKRIPGLGKKHTLRNLDPQVLTKSLPPAPVQHVLPADWPHELSGLPRAPETKLGHRAHEPLGNLPSQRALVHAGLKHLDQVSWKRGFAVTWVAAPGVHSGHDLVLAQVQA